MPVEYIHSVLRIRGRTYCRKAPKAVLSGQCRFNSNHLLLWAPWNWGVVQDSLHPTVVSPGRQIDSGLVLEWVEAIVRAGFLTKGAFCQK